MVKRFDICCVGSTDLVLSLPGILPSGDGFEFHVSGVPVYGGPGFFVSGGELLWRIALEWEHRLSEISITVVNRVRDAVVETAVRFERYISKIRCMVLRKRPCVLRL